MDNAEMCQVGGGINKIASMLIRRAGGFKAVWYLKQIPWDVYAARIMGRKFQMGPRDFKKFTFARIFACSRILRRPSIV